MEVIYTYNKYHYIYSTTKLWKTILKNESNLQIYAPHLNKSFTYGTILTITSMICQISLISTFM